MRRHLCTALWWIARKAARFAIRLEAPKLIGWYALAPKGYIWNAAEWPKTIKLDTTKKNPDPRHRNTGNA